MQNGQANCSNTNDDPLSPKDSLITTKHQIDHHDVTGHSSNALNSGIGTIKSPSKNQSDDLSLMKRLLEDDQDTQKSDLTFIDFYYFCFNSFILNTNFRRQKGVYFLSLGILFCFDEIV